MVMGQAHSGPVRVDRPDAVGALQLRSGRAAGRGDATAPGRAYLPPAIPRTAGPPGRRSAGLSDAPAVVPGAGRRRVPGDVSADPHRLLLDGVRRIRGASELLRWPRHSG